MRKVEWEVVLNHLKNSGPGEFLPPPRMFSPRFTPGPHNPSRYHNNNNNCRIISRRRCMEKYDSTRYILRIRDNNPILCIIYYYSYYYTTGYNVTSVLTIYRRVPSPHTVSANLSRHRVSSRGTPIIRRVAPKYGKTDDKAFPRTVPSAE